MYNTASVGLVVFEGSLVNLAIGEDPFAVGHVAVLPLALYAHAGVIEDIGALTLFLPELEPPRVHVFVQVGEHALAVAAPVLEVP